MSTFDGAFLVRTVGRGGISSHPYCDLRPVAAFVCKIVKLNPISPSNGHGDLATATRALRRNPAPHAEILAKRIRQNCFLITNRGRRVGGVGGLNLCKLGPRYRMGCHVQIFFPEPEV